MNEVKILEYTNKSVYAINKKDILVHHGYKTIYCGEVKDMPKEYKDMINQTTEYVIIY